MRLRNSRAPAGRIEPGRVLRVLEVRAASALVKTLSVVLVEASGVGGRDLATRVRAADERQQGNRAHAPVAEYRDALGGRPRGGAPERQVCPGAGPTRKQRAYPNTYFPRTGP